MNYELKTDQNHNDLIFDFSKVENPARIAIYDDLKSSPRIIEIQPQTTKEFIGELAASVYTQASAAGGKIAYSVIKQVSENFIHARFNEIVVSIMPGGNEIRFSDQGPGIKDKEKAKLPGFSSATHEMKRFIDGVGSGLPIANEYLKSSHGTLIIEDNVDAGTVVTLKLNSEEKTSAAVTKPVQKYEPILSDITKRGHAILIYLLNNGTSGVKIISEELGYPQSSVHGELTKLEELNLIEKVGTKRQLTKFGLEVASTLTL